MRPAINHSLTLSDRMSRAVRAGSLFLLVLGVASTLLPLQAQGARSSQAAAGDKSSAADLREGLEFYRTGNYEDAARSFARYIQTNPESIPTRKLLVQCYLKLEQPQQALQQIKELEARRPDDESVADLRNRARQILQQQREEAARQPTSSDAHRWVDRAERLIARKKTSQAEKLLLQAVEVEPDMDRAWLRLAEIYASSGRFVKAASVYRRQLARKRRANPELQLRYARALSWAGRYPNAISAFEAYLKRRPDDASAHFEIAEAHRWAGQSEEALPHYQKAIEQRPGEQTALTGLAMAYQNLGRHEDAVKTYDSIIEQHPAAEQAVAARAESFKLWQQERRRLAVSAQEEGDYAEAIALLQKYSEANPEETKVLHQLALLHMWSGQLEGARGYYGRYLEKHPDDNAARLELADALNWHGLYGPARDAYLEALGREAESQPALVGVVRTHLWSGELDGVEPYVERLEDVAPGNTLAGEVRELLYLKHKREMRERAETLEESTDYEAAAQAYREYVKTYGPDRKHELRVPRIYAWNRRYDRAVSEYHAYLNRHPDDSTVLLELAEVQRWNADYGSSLQTYDLFLSKNPQDARGLAGRAEVLYAENDDLFQVRQAYRQAFAASPQSPFLATRLQDVNHLLRTRAFIPVTGFSNSDGLKRVIVRPEVVFLLPNNYRLSVGVRSSYDSQGRMLLDTSPDAIALNREIADRGGILYSALAGARVQQARGWGHWGAEVYGGSFTDGRSTVTYGSDITFRVTERDDITMRYEHDEAGFELQTLASLLAGIQRDTLGISHRRRFGGGFDLSYGYDATYLSDSDRFGFSDNLRHRGTVRFAYRGFRAFQPGYSYSVMGYRSDSPLYFSPDPYQAHRFEYIIQAGRRKPVMLVLNGSVGVGRLNGADKLEVNVAPELSFGFPGGARLDIGVFYGQSGTSAFGERNYIQRGVRIELDIPFPAGRN